MQVRDSSEPKNLAPVAEVVDLFCGIGALSHGLKLAGFDIRAGFDIDSRCRHAFESNNDAKFFHRNVAEMEAIEITRNYSGKLPTVLAGCAPCQPFSTYKQRYEEDPKWNFVVRFAELAVQVMPDFITMENVPALLKYKGRSVFDCFLSILREAKYDVQFRVEKCEEYGVPQKRRRLVVLASKDYPVHSLKATTKKFVSVRDKIANLPPLSAGEIHSDDPLHRAAKLSDLNLKRIRASKAGGTWRDWPEELVAACHRKASGRTYPGVYARMTWDEPSPTLTTQCFGYGNGRFGHPEQDRAISLREAAILQSFPENYEFLPEGESPNMKEVGKWIGNAVPVELARQVGNAIKASLEPTTAEGV